jgi:hypothetical protein
MHVALSPLSRKAQNSKKALELVVVTAPNFLSSKVYSEFALTVKVNQRKKFHVLLLELLDYTTQEFVNARSS